MGTHWCDNCFRIKSASTTEEAGNFDLLHNEVH